ncbi:type III polyketide synthase [Rhodovibrio salinarum]|uniref:Type III polyketide synthase n=1 Tax=Rhodovibrio salinarum TaxID=1087 RepID=A0A934QKC7_9PROT|nr:type III polyketide synthase [Rhodovibrio salinarum]MBK1698120.1 type III polyketide synthase [Rhodovibrio salinarum]
MSEPPRLTALTTAVPPYPLDQADVRARARRIFNRPDIDLDRLMPVYDHAGIRRRYSCVPIDWYGQSIGWKARNDLYERHALDLLTDVAERALAQADLRAGEIDTILTVSTTGITTPSLDARLMNRLAFRRDTARLPVFGLGCCGGILGLGRAADLASSGKRVLLLTVELCALTFRAGDFSKSNLVATALFGDGATGAVISGVPGDVGTRLIGWGEHTWQDSLDVMGWTVEDDGLGVLFSRDIPSLVGTAYGSVLDTFLARHHLTRAGIAATACHPGGAKVVAALETVFGLQEGAMAAERRVLRDYGNMSAPTVLFVLREVLQDATRGPILASALGPGFSAGFALLDPSSADP